MGELPEYATNLPVVSTIYRHAPHPGVELSLNGQKCPKAPKIDILFTLAGPDFRGSGFPDFGFRISNFGFRISDFGHSDVRI